MFKLTRYKFNNIKQLTRLRKYEVPFKIVKGTNAMALACTGPQDSDVMNIPTSISIFFNQRISQHSYNKVEVPTMYLGNGDAF